MRKGNGRKMKRKKEQERDSVKIKVPQANFTFIQDKEFFFSHKEYFRTKGKIAARNGQKIKCFRLLNLEKKLNK